MGPGWVVDETQKAEIRAFMSQLLDEYADICDLEQMNAYWEDEEVNSPDCN
jgi:hypothetical protein